MVVGDPLECSSTENGLLQSMMIDTLRYDLHESNVWI